LKPPLWRYEDASAHGQEMTKKDLLLLSARFERAACPLIPLVELVANQSVSEK
jgi:hypothetical protein